MKTRISHLFASLAVVSALGGAVPGLAADSNGAAVPVAGASATLTPAEHFDVGGALVERHGERGTPLILIPGLASGAWVWQDVVRQFKGDHVLYVITLPGFDGRPAIAGKGMQAAEDALVELIATRKLVKPVLIGHSLGATLSFSLASHHSELLGGLVAIDGLPVFPGTETMEPAQRAQMAQGMKARMAAADQEAFALQQLQFMRVMGVIDGAKAVELAKLTARSDPAATLDYMAEDFVLDLRQGLPNIKVPVLLISPYFAPDAQRMKISEQAKTDYYKSLIAGVPNAQVVSVSPARHFAMFDQPKQVADAISSYLKSVK